MTNPVRLRGAPSSPLFSVRMLVKARFRAVRPVSALIPSSQPKTFFGIPSRSHNQIHTRGDAALSVLESAPRRPVRRSVDLRGLFPREHVIAAERLGVECGAAELSQAVLQTSYRIIDSCGWPLADRKRHRRFYQFKAWAQVERGPSPDIFLFENRLPRHRFGFAGDIFNHDDEEGVPLRCRTVRCSTSVKRRPHRDSQRYQGTNSLHPSREAGVFFDPGQGLSDQGVSLRYDGRNTDRRVSNVLVPL